MTKRGIHYYKKRLPVGKLKTGLPFSPTDREGNPPNILQFQAATQRSACVDIPCPKDMELLVIHSAYKINTDYYGPIPFQTMGLILSRSSCTMKGLTVMTGVIDKDYIRKISIMVQVIRNLYLQKGDKFAQLLLLPYIKPQKTSTTTGMGGFRQH